MIVIGMLGSGYIRDLNRIESEVDKISSNRVSKADPGQDSAILSLHDRLRRQDSKHTNEMIHRYNSIDKRVSIQEKKLFDNTKIIIRNQTLLERKK